MQSGPWLEVEEDREGGGRNSDSAGRRQRARGRGKEGGGHGGHSGYLGERKEGRRGERDGSQGRRRVSSSELGIWWEHGSEG